MYYLKYDELDLTLLFFSGPGVFLPFRPFLQFVKMLKKKQMGLLTLSWQRLTTVDMSCVFKKPKSPKVITSNMQKKWQPFKCLSFSNDPCHLMPTRKG
jgi:hypothetical protein